MGDGFIAVSQLEPRAPSEQIVALSGHPDSTVRFRLTFSPGFVNEMPRDSSCTGAISPGVVQPVNFKKALHVNTKTSSSRPSSTDGTNMPLSRGIGSILGGVAKKGRPTSMIVGKKGSSDSFSFATRSNSGNPSLDNPSSSLGWTTNVITSAEATSEPSSSIEKPSNRTSMGAGVVDPAGNGLVQGVLTQFFLAEGAPRRTISKLGGDKGRLTIKVVEGRDLGDVTTGFPFLPLTT